MNLRAYYKNRFFFKTLIDFRVLAQKCLKPCVNGVLKFKFFFLNLSSNLLAGVTVRMSKYPYMDICAEEKSAQLFLVFFLKVLKCFSLQLLCFQV